MGYYPGFPLAIPHLGIRSIALLALSPLAPKGTFDLHVLAMPPAFNLSQDQTLQLNFVAHRRGVRRRPRRICFKEGMSRFGRSPLRDSGHLGRACCSGRTEAGLRGSRSFRASGGLGPRGYRHSKVAIKLGRWGTSRAKRASKHENVDHGRAVKHVRGLFRPIDPCLGLRRAPDSISRTFSRWTQLFTCQRGRAGSGVHPSTPLHPIGPGVVLPFSLGCRILTVSTAGRFELRGSIFVFRSARRRVWRRGKV